jgi:argininosuccinate synthase
MSAPNKVVLAYSGGLDTSIILKWLETEYGCEVVTFTADFGQGEELEPARRKVGLRDAKPKTSFIENLRGGDAVSMQPSCRGMVTAAKH